MPDRQAGGQELSRVLTEVAVGVSVERTEYVGAYRWRVQCFCGATQGPSLDIWYYPQDGDEGLEAATRQVETIAGQAAAEAFVIWTGIGGAGNGSQGDDG